MTHQAAACSAEMNCRAFPSATVTGGQRNGTGDKLDDGVAGRHVALVAAEPFQHMYNSHLALVFTK